MKREFAINIGLLLIANLFIKAFYLLGIDRQMQLTVGTENYGLYYKLLSVTLIFQFINDFGIQNYTNRYVSQNREEIRHQYKDFAGLKIILSVIYMIAVFLFAVIMDYRKEVHTFILHLAFNQVLISAVFFVRSNISGLGFYKTDSFFSVLDRILLIIMGSLLLWHPYFSKYISIESFVWIQTISLFITLFATIYFVRLKHLVLSFWLIDRKAIRKILFACLPFAMIYLFSSLYNKVDVVIIGKLLKDGDHQAGIYASSMRLFEASSMISLAFGSLLLSMFSSLHNKPEKLAELFRMAMNLLVVITMIIVTTTCFNADEIMQLLYGQSDPYWTSIFELTMIAFIPASLNYILGAFMPAVHREKPLMKFYFIASTFSLIINILLISQWKVVGAAYSAIATHTVLFLIQFVYILKGKYMDIHNGFWIQILLYLAVSVLIAYGLQFMQVHWIFKVVLTGMLLIAIAFCSRMISIKDFLKTI